jgi:hypothetical protein
MAAQVAHLKYQDRQIMNKERKRQKFVSEFEEMVLAHEAKRFGFS